MGGVKQKRFTVSTDRGTSEQKEAVIPLVDLIQAVGLSEQVFIDGGTTTLCGKSIRFAGSSNSRKSGPGMLTE
jgi:hypothetical protein